MDERVRLVKEPGGKLEVRVRLHHAADLGLDGVSAELHDRGFAPGDLGQPFKKGGYLRIPVRRVPND